jgi:hypothetical protein
MERRELLKMIAVLTGAVVVGGDLFLSGCKAGAKADAGFTPANISLLDEVGETIIPTTDTPGAKAAKIGAFMQTMITDCYKAKDQVAFVEGLSTLEAACKKANGKSFMECTPQERHNFLITLEKEAKAYNTKRDEEDKPKKEANDKANSSLAWKDQKEFEGAPSHYYTMIKQLTLWGFFTSETGSTKTLRHVPVPTRYDGNVAYKKGDKAWAE